MLLFDPIKPRSGFPFILLGKLAEKLFDGGKGELLTEEGKGELLLAAWGKGELPKGSAPVEPAAAEVSKSDVEGAAAGPGGEEKALFEVVVGKGETVEEGKEGWEEDCGMKGELEEGEVEEGKAKFDSSGGERRP